MVRTLYFLLLPALLLGGCASRRVQPPEPGNERVAQPGLLSRSLDVVRGSPDRINRAGLPRVRDLAVKTFVNPDPIVVGARKFDVTFAIRNNAKSTAVNLRFKTSQRIEVAVVDESGKLIERWSDDHAFSQQAGYLVINPTEEAAYTVSLSTRELAAGRNYTIEAYFVGYEQLIDKVKVSTR